jgi:hypothetical protein
VLIEQSSGNFHRTPAFLGHVFVRTPGNIGKSYATLKVMQGLEGTLTMYVDDPDQLLALAEESTALAHKLQKQLNADAAADAVMNADDAREMAEATL